MDLNEIYSLVKDDISEAERAAKLSLSQESEFISEIASYMFDGKSKLIRATLHMLCAGMCNADKGTANTIASCLELLHNATLMHDDIIDGALLRRGSESVNSRFGNDVTVLAGDYLYANAFTMIAELDNVGLIRLLAQTTKFICSSEIQQLNNIGNINLAEGEYMKIIHGKTAALFGATCSAVAIANNQRTYEERTLALYGHHLGYIFQISDDMLDYFSQPHITGKTLHKDLYEGKITFPMIKLLREVTPEEKDFIQRIAMANPPSSERDEISAQVNALMKNYNIEEKCNEHLKDLAIKTAAYLYLFDVEGDETTASYKEALRSLPAILISRES